MIMQVEPLHARTDPKISVVVIPNVGLLSDCPKGGGTHPEMYTPARTVPLRPIRDHVKGSTFPFGGDVEPLTLSITLMGDC